MCKFLQSRENCTKLFPNALPACTGSSQYFVFIFSLEFKPMSIFPFSLLANFSLLLPSSPWTEIYQILSKFAKRRFWQTKKIRNFQFSAFLSCHKLLSSSSSMSSSAWSVTFWNWSEWLLTSICNSNTFSLLSSEYLKIFLIGLEMDYRHGLVVICEGNAKYHVAIQCPLGLGFGRVFTI